MREMGEGKEGAETPYDYRRNRTRRLGKDVRYHSFVLEPTAASVETARSSGGLPLNVLLLHGMAQSHTSWLKTAHGLVRLGHRVLLLDLLGWGQSTRAACEIEGLRLSIPLYVGQVRHAVCERGWDREGMAIAGVSLGAATAMEYTRRFGFSKPGDLEGQGSGQRGGSEGCVAHVRSLVLIASAGRFERGVARFVGRQVLGGVVKFVYRLGGRTPATEASAGRIPLGESLVVGGNGEGDTGAGEGIEESDRGDHVGRQGQKRNPGAVRRLVTLLLRWAHLTAQTPTFSVHPRVFSELSACVSTIVFLHGLHDSLHSAAPFIEQLQQLGQSSQGGGEGGDDTGRKEKGRSGDGDSERRHVVWRVYPDHSHTSLCLSVPRLRLERERDWWTVAVSPPAISYTEAALEGQRTATESGEELRDVALRGRHRVGQTWGPSSPSKRRTVLASGVLESHWYVPVGSSPRSCWNQAPGPAEGKQVKSFVEKADAEFCGSDLEQAKPSVGLPSEKNRPPKISSRL
uniref:AB hydrolase-1 domain-containing protein n=1 Tax=Chromera velia CCMP2878 TaxID=1169474 RepID=A0A0G4GMA3_9ALVE|eukprot:Cvel_22532.t1-p1 / transcript=Cvel_22532.t1 / gene=Cvel_22532 / organism=Chromera_velia_CCMP2878 / gene_product=hypothetical protein / transcript_product=hypothetical protein / location=Cvel_scaffold2224:8429-10832(+) / protein_length=515 / sequence_SO=supercontig / SO=protein_coding / is_pseudo=false